MQIIAKTKWEIWRAQTFEAKEPETIAWINDFVDGIFWDIGANIGIYSLYCAEKHPQMKIHAFEPMRNNFLRLWQNIFLNNYHQITGHYSCVGNDDADCTFVVASEKTGSSGGQAFVVPASCDGHSSYTVPMVSGDGLCWTNQYQTPQYVKIDTDGNEHDVLMGMRTVLADTTLKSVLVEINNHDDDIHYLMSQAGLIPDSKYNKLKTRKSDHNVIFTRK